MAKDVFISKEEYEAIMKSLSDEIKELYKALVDITDNYTALMKGDKVGDKDVAYWSGAAAVNFYKRAQRNLENSLKYYKEAVALYKNLIDQYDKFKPAWGE